MSTMWDFVKLKLPSKAFLQDQSVTLWDRYTDWLLGEDVYENVVKDHTGEVIMRPSWHTLMELEFQVRRRMCWEINCNSKSIGNALMDAQKHEPTFTKYFTLPTSLSAASSARRQPDTRKRSRSRERSADGATEDARKDPPWGRGKGDRGRRGKGTGKGKGSKDNRKSGWRSGQSGFTPDGRMKCYRYQRNQCSGGCNKVHACLVCNGNHPMISCPRRPPRTGDAAGAAAGGAAGDAR